jgi:hypothetical protein
MLAHKTKCILYNRRGWSPEILEFLRLCPPPPKKKKNQGSFHVDSKYSFILTQYFTGLLHLRTSNGRIKPRTFCYSIICGFSHFKVVMTAVLHAHDIHFINAKTHVIFRCFSYHGVEVTVITLNKT